MIKARIEPTKVVGLIEVLQKEQKMENQDLEFILSFLKGMMIGFSIIGGLSIFAMGALLIVL